MSPSQVSPPAKAADETDAELAKKALHGSAEDWHELTARCSDREFATRLLRALRLHGADHSQLSAWLGVVRDLHPPCVAGGAITGQTDT